MLQGHTASLWESKFWLGHRGMLNRHTAFHHTLEKNRQQYHAAKNCDQSLNCYKTHEMLTEEEQTRPQYPEGPVCCCESAQPLIAPHCSSIRLRMLHCKREKKTPHCIYAGKQILTPASRQDWQGNETEQTS